jgi:hypothetical protein
LRATQRASGSLTKKISFVAAPDPWKPSRLARSCASSATGSTGALAAGDELPHGVDELVAPFALRETRELAEELGELLAGEEHPAGVPALRDAPEDVGVVLLALERNAARTELLELLLDRRGLNADAPSEIGLLSKEPSVSNVIPFPPRTPRIEPNIAAPVPLYRLAVTRAKALGLCPDPANDAPTRASRATRRKFTADNGTWVGDGLALLLELSIRAVVESRTGTRGS